MNKTDKAIVRAMVLMELGIKESVKSSEYNVFSSLGLFEIFKKEIKMSDTIFFSIMRLLKAFEVIRVSYGEKVLSKPKWLAFQKEFPHEYAEALQEIKLKEVKKE